MASLLANISNDISTLQISTNVNTRQERESQSSGGVRAGAEVEERRGEAAGGGDEAEVGIEEWGGGRGGRGWRLRGRSGDCDCQVDLVVRYESKLGGTDL